MSCWLYANSLHTVTQVFFFNVGVAGVGEHLSIRLIIGMLTAEVVCIVSSPIRMASLL